MKRLLFILLLLPAFAQANVEASLDSWPDRSNDQAALQRGAKLFINYCLNCHSATSMRYNRMQDLGLTDEQIRGNLMFAGEKVGQTMSVAMRAADAKVWFGAAPPDLSVIARSRGADWLYTYFRSFYRDAGRPTGWNNVVFPNVGMPHVLAELQGEQDRKEETAKDAHGVPHYEMKMETVRPGSMTAAEYDGAIADLVAYLVYMGEPAAAQRKRMGAVALIVLALLFGVTYWLKKEYWKDVH